MLNNYKKFNKIQLLIGLIILIKIFYFFLLNSYDCPYCYWENEFIRSGGDSFSYIEPIENLLKSGEYSPDFRIPGYGFTYLIFRFFLPMNIALSALGIFQLLMDIIAVILLSKIAKEIFLSKKAQFFILIVYGLSCYVSEYNSSVLTDSITASVSIIGIYFFIQALKKESNLLFLISGIFIMWAFFLRVVSIGLFLVSLSIILDKLELKKKLKYLVIFLFPFILIESIWIGRNYSKYEKIVPFSKTWYYPDEYDFSVFNLHQFVKSWGGSVVFWDHNSEINFFTLSHFQDESKKIELPKYIYTSKFNRDSLVLLNSSLKLEIDSTKSFDERLAIAQFNKNKLEIYTASVKEEKPFLYYIGSRFLILKKYLFQSGTTSFFEKRFSELSFGLKGLKLLLSMLYWLVLVFGIIGIFYCSISSLKNRTIKGNFKFILANISIYLLFVYPIIFKTPEWRYLVCAYPFLVLFAYDGFMLFYSKIFLKKE